jgi:hypothetical protein
MTRVTFLKFWSIGVGSMDALTGLLLILFPALVLDLLKIRHPSPDALVFLSWIGVFVMAVGLSYGLALGKRGRGEAVWMFTSMVRILVAVFLTFRILDGSLQKQWALVALADAAVALVQMAALRAGWWKEVHR